MNTNQHDCVQLGSKVIELNKTMEVRGGCQNKQTKSTYKLLTYEKEEKVGFLWKKRSEQKKSYKKRYFILCGNILAYFDKKLDKEPLGIIFLDCHIVEMLDDLKMAIRFRGPAEEIEDWMRAISRCSIEYITLTLEDLEDHYKALTTVKQTNHNLIATNQSIDRNSTLSLVKSSLFSKRSNPFNRNSNNLNTATDYHPTIVIKNQSGIQCSTDSLNHTKWLLTQNWEQLNACLKSQFIQMDKNIIEKKE
ncbi:unnamed protein product [Heterobilharzia americana]|nr:unnamed protein product [Heterobilharzia americana]